MAEEFKISADEIIFSMDIGTRTVVGIVGKKEKDHFVIIETEVMEHTGRAMYDGQIHDMDKVADVAAQVKSRLEKKLGLQLQHVAIAAAGRALKTYRAQVIKEIDFTRQIDQEMINSLEMEAIQRAEEKLEQDENNADTKYYCVGHTAVNYYLNDGIITSLKDHRGNKIGVDLIATFLPYVVVDSLQTVMGKIGLEVAHLTLEPIAAIHVAIPPKLRLLNLALIDIGAGTSDIAITKDGVIGAYAMASVAGDELTEVIAREFLLDFETAEKLKIELNKQESHAFKDIVGIPYTMTTDEIIERIKTSIESLAQEIADKVIEYNGKGPSAVFCIGGGSQIPSFTEHLAEKLGIPKERVVVRGTELIESLEFSCEKLVGPEFITPIGIGVISAKDREKNYIQVRVNKSYVKLYPFKALRVSDALIRAGFSARKLIARKGRNIGITINGVSKILQGEMGEPSQIYVNGKAGSLDTPINDKDDIVVKPAIDGKDSSISLKELIKNLKSIRFNGVDIQLINQLTVNGQKVSMEYILKDGDNIAYEEINHVQDLLTHFKMNINHYDVYVNDIKREKDFKLSSSDNVITYLKESSEKEEKLANAEVAVELESLTMIVYVNGEPLEMNIGKKSPIFIDIFNYIDFDLTTPKKNLQLILNGNKASYTDPLQEGDKIEILWDK